MEVVATVVSPTFIQCYTPVNTDFDPNTPYNAQDKTLEVSLNGVDWTNSKKTFTFYDHSRVFVSLLVPQGGPLAGGTEIQIQGSSFRYSEHLRCTWDNNTDPAFKVAATYVDYHTLKCLSPPAAVSGLRTLEIALDDYHFTGHGRQWTYYNPLELVVSAVDPIGGPVRGGTLIEVLGTGFEKLGGTVQHGSEAFPGDHKHAYGRLDSGAFCKFSIDAARAPRGEEPWCSQIGEVYHNLVDPDSQPREGDAALMRTTSNRHLRNVSCFTVSTTPSLGRLSSVVQATVLSSGRMLCESPPFAGVMRNNRAVLRVHVSLNGDFHEIGSLSQSNATFAIYDPREARIQTLDRIGGPIDGSTYIVVQGKLFSDFTSRMRTSYSHLLRCRFGDAGSTFATLLSDRSVACFSPKLNGTGHRQSISLDLTYNGQDYLNGPSPHFIYSPLDSYTVSGTCRDAYGARLDGTCTNNFTGIAVSELQPYGGPSTGETKVIVIGRLFQVQGPSIMCKFGNLSMVPATFLNESALACISPPNPDVNGSGFHDSFVEVTLNGERNFLTTSQVPFAYYNHNETLAVSSIYPEAGPKGGGNTITVYGAGFRVLGGALEFPCDAVPTNSTAAEELYGDRRTEGSLSRGRTKLLGDSQVCAQPLLDGTNRGLQCLFGNMPPVHAYLVRLGSDPLNVSAATADVEDDRVGTALICELPPLPAQPVGQDCVNNAAGHGCAPNTEGEYTSYVAGPRAARELLPGGPITVCVEITLNGNRSQATRDCAATFTYYDV